MELRSRNHTAFRIAVPVARSPRPAFSRRNRAQNTRSTKRTVGMFYLCLLYSFLCLLCFVPDSVGQSLDPQPTLRIVRVSEPLQFDDFPDAADGLDNMRAVPVTGFRQRDPGDGAAVSAPTT